MPIDLFHLGEAIVQQLIERRPDLFFKLCGLPHTEVHGGKVFREVPLRPFAGKRFDGASRVDLIVPVSASEAIAVEVKLGETRLSRTRVDTEWIADCRASHDGKRWAGNMMAILERNFPSGADSEPIAAQVDGAIYTVLPQWYVLVRRATAQAWRGPGRPGFRNATVVAFDDLASGFGAAEFDRVVRELVSFSYYETWMKAPDSNR